MKKRATKKTKKKEADERTFRGRKSFLLENVSIPKVKLMRRLTMIDKKEFYANERFLTVKLMTKPKMRFFCCKSKYLYFNLTTKTNKKLNG